jgi:hypothetical protein
MTSHPPARAALLSPITLGALALLVLNDHVLKATMPGALTGKLSDIAGMVFFPLLLAAGLEMAKLRHRHLVIGSAIATGLVFAAIKTIGPAGDAYRYGLAALQWPFRAVVSLVQGHGAPPLGQVKLTMDPTDLMAIPAVLVAVWLVRERDCAARESMVMS